jgi:hypothetical protein
LRESGTMLEGERMRRLRTITELKAQLEARDETVRRLRGQIDALQERHARRH